MAMINLARLLRERTADLHGRAERAGIMRNVLSGQFDQRTYCMLLRNLHAIYACLEPALASHATYFPIDQIYDARLIRQHALVADLNMLYGKAWAHDIGLARATVDYTVRIAELSRTRPTLLVAHAYTRYLGDLSGGQVLARIVSGTLQTDRVGTDFDVFPEPGAAALAMRFREGLAGLGLDEAVCTEIATEARTAFSLHIEMFEQLADHEWSVPPVAHAKYR